MNSIKCLALALVALHASATSVIAHNHPFPLDPIARAQVESQTTEKKNEHQPSSPLGFMWKTSGLGYFLNSKAYKNALWAKPITDPELQHTVNVLLDRYGIKKGTVSVMLFDRTLLQPFAHFFTECYTMGRSIFIDKNFLKTLSTEEIEFFIAHELSHVIHNYSVKMAPFGFLWIPLVYLSYRAVNHQSMPDLVKNHRWISGTALYFTAWAPIRPLWFSLAKRQEKQADLDAANACNSAKGGISAFKRMKFDQEKMYGIELPDYLHPSLTERIEYLEQWERDNEAQKATVEVKN